MNVSCPLFALNSSPSMLDERLDSLMKSISLDSLRCSSLNDCIAFKTSLDIFWIKDKSLTDLDNLPDPDELAEEIIQNLESGLNSFKEIMQTLDN